MNRLVISSQSDLEALRHSQYLEKMLDRALTDWQQQIKENDKLIADLQRERAKNQPLRANLEWALIGLFAFLVVAVVEAVALYWTH